MLRTKGPQQMRSLDLSTLSIKEEVPQETLLVKQAFLYKIPPQVLQHIMS